MESWDEMIQREGMKDHPSSSSPSRWDEWMRSRVIRREKQKKRKELIQIRSSLMPFHSFLCSSKTRQRMSFARGLRGLCFLSAPLVTPSLALLKTQAKETSPHDSPSSQPFLRPALFDSSSSSFPLSLFLFPFLSSRRPLTPSLKARPQCRPLRSLGRV